MVRATSTSVVKTASFSVMLVLFSPVTSRAQECPPPTPGSFDHITEVPYGDPPDVADFDTLYGNFLAPAQGRDFCDPETFFANAPADYFCPDVCVETEDCTLENQCPNIADEPVSAEMADPAGPDWFRTDFPTPCGGGACYNCLAYAVGHQDFWLWGECDDPGSQAEAMTPAAIQRVMLEYGYRPSATCFPACGVRKVVGLGGWLSLNVPSSFGFAHAAVEVGDRSPEDPDAGGWWESKFGTRERVLHRFWDIAGGCFGYGGPVVCWERDEPGANPDLCGAGYDAAADAANQPPAEICERWGAENYLFCRAEFCAANPAEACPPDDPDHDGVPFPIYLCPEDANTGLDRDVDGVDDACDNCIDVSNQDQANCDDEWDVLEPQERRGDACDPDPCTAWHYTPGRNPLTPSVGERILGDVEVGRTAYLSFDSLGGEIDLDVSDHYGADETFQDVQVAYCACRDAADCRDVCNDAGRLDGNPQTGTGWFEITRKLDGERTTESLTDVLFERGGPGTGGAAIWDWQEDPCPSDNGSVDCVDLADQRFTLWLRPLVDPATWATGWPEDGDVVVWEDYRNDPNANRGPPKNIDIYARDLASGEEMPVTSFPGLETRPRVWERTVYFEYRSAEAGGLLQVFGVDLGNGR